MTLLRVLPVLALTVLPFAAKADLYTCTFDTQCSTDGCTETNFNRILEYYIDDELDQRGWLLIGEAGSQTGINGSFPGSDTVIAFFAPMFEEVGGAMLTLTMDGQVVLTDHNERDGMTSVLSYSGTCE